MKRYRLDPKKPRQLTRSDLARIDRMKDEDIDYSDIPPLDNSFFTRPTVDWPPTKRLNKKKPHEQC